MNRFRELLLILLLSGCASVPPALPPDMDAVLPGDRAGITHWQLRGRVSLTRGEQGWHAGLDWQMQDDSYRLQVSGPLGQGAFLLSGNSDAVTLTDSDGNVYAAADAESLLEQATGWQLPVGGLRYWVRGIAAPRGTVEVTRDEQGSVRQLVQSGWTITYQRYRDVAGSSWPAKIRLEREDLVVKLVIDQWLPEQAGAAPR